MLSASKKIDYAVLVMASLPEMGTQEFRSLQEIAREKGLSANFLGQLMMPLKSAGLVSSREGKHGGYQLSKAASELSLREVFEAIEGPIALTSCLNSSKNCACESSCPTKILWKELQDTMNDYLSHKFLSDFR